MPTPEMNAALAAPLVRPAFLFEGVFAGGTIYAWTGLGPLEWNGHTWLGVGDLLQISSVQQTDEIKANGITVSLSGVKSAAVALALDEMQRNKSGTLWLALFDAADAIVADPEVIFRGRLDGCTIDDDAESCQISVRYEHELVTLERPKEVRYTDEEQQRLFADDLACQYVPSLQDKTLRWGSTGAA